MLGPRGIPSKCMGQSLRVNPTRVERDVSCPFHSTTERRTPIWERHVIAVMRALRLRGTSLGLGQAAADTVPPPPSHLSFLASARCNVWFCGQLEGVQSCIVLLHCSGNDLGGGLNHIRGRGGPIFRVSSIKNVDLDVKTSKQVRTKLAGIQSVQAAVWYRGTRQGRHDHPPPREDAGRWRSLCAVIRVAKLDAP